MTPAVKQLKKLSVPYNLHQYQHDTDCKSFGLEAVEKLQVSPNSVFKTLVVDVCLVKGLGWTNPSASQANLWTNE